MFRNKIIVLLILLIILVITFTLITKIKGRVNQEKSIKALCPNCNVIVVTLDTLGADHMGLYGYKIPTTPFLDSFGLDRSIVFDQAIAQGSWTPLSHTSILTGRYPEEYGIYGSGDKLPPGTQTLAVALKDRGYTTHAVSAAILIQPKWGWGQGFDSFDQRWYLGSVKTNDAKDTFTHAVAWIKINKKQPFFLFINSNHLHSPHTPETTNVLEELGYQPPFNINDERDVVGPDVNKGIATKQDLTLLKTNYDGLVREVDDQVKYFINELDKMGLTKNTIIIFEGDHSQQFGEHNILGWYGVYNTQIHVPFILYVPGQKPQRISSVVELRSIPSTVLDLIGAKPDPSFHGPSLLPLLLGKAENIIALTMNAQTVQGNLGMLQSLFAKSPSVWDSMKNSPDPTVRNVKDIPQLVWHSARSNDWQLIKNGDGSLELYNLKIDPKENINLISDWGNLSSSDKNAALKLFKALNLKSL